MEVVIPRSRFGGVLLTEDTENTDMVMHPLGTGSIIPLEHTRMGKEITTKVDDLKNYIHSHCSKVDQQ